MIKDGEDQQGLRTAKLENLCWKLFKMSMDAQSVTELFKQEKPRVQLV